MSIFLICNYINNYIILFLFYKIYENNEIELKRFIDSLQDKVNLQVEEFKIRKEEVINRSYLGNINFEATGKVIAITGSYNSGKSSITCILAKEYAKQGKKTLIIDFDIFNSSINYFFGVQKYNKGAVAFNLREQIVHISDKEDVLCSIDLLFSNNNTVDYMNLEELLNDFKIDYDIILIDNTSNYEYKYLSRILNSADTIFYLVVPTKIELKKSMNLLEVFIEDFKVNLKNKVNDHEQIILRNTEGVYVLTPSLNKSFKFQSEWPYNNSQTYILQTLLKDIEKDENKVIEKIDNGYKIETVVNYDSNSDMKKQQIILDEDFNFKEVSILDNQNQIKMKMKFNNIDYKATFDENYFDLNKNIIETEENTSSTLDSIVYPMYLPINTQLSGQEKISMENGERVILTFSGDSPFMLVQETANVQEEFTTIPMYGEPHMITGSIGAVSDSSVTWIEEGVEFYVVSEVLSKEELLDIASSVSVAALK